MDTANLFSPTDVEQLDKHGISLSEAVRQVGYIRQGTSYMSIQAPASLEKGIVRLSPEEEAYYMDAWAVYLQSKTAHVCKMIPASGAASRMFKSLYNFLDGAEAEPREESVRIFFDNLANFAFYEKLSHTCLRNNWTNIPKLLEEKQYKIILENLLKERGMNYGKMPKGLILFHSYPKGACTSAEEHLVEGAMYARQADGKVQLHFTVSPEHRTIFESTIERTRAYYEDKFGVYYDVTYSEQKLETDTIALTPDGELFRKDNGELLLRPGGHGALISNLGDLEADIIFIKNIDNVVPDYLKGTTVMYKKLLGGILVRIREQIYDYLRLLEQDNVPTHTLHDIGEFLEKNLCIEIPRFAKENPISFKKWLINKLDRPLRVCGMVRNSGEPGGGPFIIHEPDGSTSVQILESSQINTKEDSQKAHLESSHYFNPVDLVCSIKNYKGEKYDLTHFINDASGFLSSKSMGGRALIALERPGLWNGAMHGWLSVFVEVPYETFNPVKEVNDLLRQEHQPE